MKKNEVRTQTIEAEERSPEKEVRNKIISRIL